MIETSDDDKRIAQLRDRVTALESAPLFDSTAEKVETLGVVQERNIDHIVTLIERTDGIEERVFFLAQQVQTQAERINALERDAIDTAARNREMAVFSVELFDVFLDLIRSEKKLDETEFYDLFDRIRVVAARAATATSSLVSN